MSADAQALLATGDVHSHRMATRLEVRLGGLGRAVPTITGGTVTVDVDASTRRRCSLNVIATDELIPARETDLLYPGRAHLHLWRGIDWQDDRPGIAFGAEHVDPGLELWPLGVFLLLRTEVTNDGNGVALKLDGYDLSKRVERNAWTAPYVIAAGSSVIASWQALITDRYPGAAVDVRSVNDTTTAQLVYGDRPQANPWEDARKLGALAAAESFVDELGTFVLAGLTSPAGVPPVAQAIAADPVVPGSSRLAGVSRVLDAEKGYSEAIVDADRAGDAPLRGIARDTDPGSATYIDGDYGPVPVFIGGSSASDQATIDTQAAGVLQLRSAASDTLSVDLVPNPAHQERDVIHVQDPPTKVDAVCTLDSFSVPLDERTTMKATVRRVA